jgi:hypothetical protein
MECRLAIAVNSVSIRCQVNGSYKHTMSALLNEVLFVPTLIKCDFSRLFTSTSLRTLAFFLLPLVWVCSFALS